MMGSSENTNRIRGLSNANGMGLLLVLFVFMVAGCAKVGPDYRPPTIATAQQWIPSKDPAFSKERVVYKDWWKHFSDPTLDNIIRMAHQQNLPLRIAGVRVLQARAQRGLSAGAFWPQLQEISASYTRVQLTKELSVGGAPPPGPTFKRRFDDNTAAFSAAWELDLWGRFRRNIESADAAVLASVYDYEDVLVTLLGDVASTYIDIRAFEERIKLAQENVDIQKKTLNTTQVRFKQGLVAELDVQQALANLSNTQALIPLLQDGHRQSQNRLCILLGMPTHDLRELLGEASTIPQPPKEIGIGIPADLLRRRPDVRNAERLAASQSGQIGVAFSDLLPHISLRGSIGISANQTNQWWRGSAVESSFGPSFRWDILNYGRIKNNVRVEDARLEALLINYQQTVLVAHAEVENSLSRFVRSSERKAFLEKSVEAAKRSLKLANVQYSAGTLDFIRLLNSESFLVTQQDNLTLTRQELARSLIQLYRALGGGWELRLGHEFVPAETIQRMSERTDWGNIVNPDYPTKSDVLWGRPKPDDNTPREGVHAAVPDEDEDDSDNQSSGKTEKVIETPVPAAKAEETNNKESLKAGEEPAKEEAPKTAE